MAEHDTTEGTEAAEAGLPQFQFQYWGGQIVWLVLMFVLVYALMSRVFVPRNRSMIQMSLVFVFGSRIPMASLLSSGERAGFE